MSNDLLGSVRVEVQKFKALMKETFDGQCEMGQYTLKFYLLDHRVEDLNHLKLLNSSAFERFSVNIKQAY